MYAKFTQNKGETVLYINPHLVEGFCPHIKGVRQTNRTDIYTASCTDEDRYYTVDQDVEEVRQILTECVENWRNKNVNRK